VTATTEFRIRKRLGRFYWVEIDPETERVLSTATRDHDKMIGALDDAFRSGAKVEDGPLLYEGDEITMKGGDE
jgi:hypothetical protein